MNDQFSTPILFIVFNRPDTTRVVFEVIKKIKPVELYIAADGPRENNKEDAEKIKSVKEVFNDIDWPCEIHTLFREKNLGCKMGATSAVNWFFSNVTKGIILEDDCVPDLSFFPYCAELLDRYEDNPKIMHIGGSGFQSRKAPENQSYYFSLYCEMWGWATWRRAWQYNDTTMKSLPEFIKAKKIKETFKKRVMRDYWLSYFDKVYNNEIDTWDYQWQYAIWRQHALVITSNVNMVANIGFREDATHTKSPSKKFQIPAMKMPFPLIHPSAVKQDEQADDYTFYHILFRETPKQKMLRLVFQLFPRSFKTSLKKLIKKQ